MPRYLLAVFSFLLLLLVIPQEAWAQNTSNKGRDFWIGYMAHIENETPNPQNGVSQMNLYVTSDVNTTVTVTVGNGTPTTHQVTANLVTVISVLPTLAYVGSSEVIERKAIHVTALHPVVVYSHIYHFNKSGATLVLPTPTLGRSYYTINYNQTQLNPFPERATSQFMVVALEDNTVVEITPTAPTLAGKPAGVTFSPTRPLMRGEVYQVRSFQDLTGSKIESVSAGTGASCKRIAVFSGSSYTYIPQPFNCPSIASGDNLYQQLYPISAWGKNFVTVPFASRSSNEIYRVLASEDNTAITINNATVTRNKGQYYEFENDGTNSISATKPVQVTQYTKSQYCDNVLSDPDMVLINPVEQTLKDITLYSSPYFQISDHYINVTMKAQDTATFRLDGRKVPFTPIPQNSVFAYSQNTVAGGNHTLKADSGFNAMAYGFGNVESYAYSAGANVTNLNQNITVLSDSICDGRNLRFRGFAVYQPLAWKWYFGDGSTSSEQNPSHKFANAGTYTISLVTTKSNGVDCNSQDSTFIELEVHDTPVANFSFVSPCTNDSTRFTNQTQVNAAEVIKGWLWDFGDGTTSTKQHPAHLYKTPGTYTVKLSVVTEALCVNEISKTVTITSPPSPSFTLPATCGLAATFQNSTPVPAGSTIRWLWDFGDGTAQSTARNPSHTYTAPGTYLVKLKAINAGGCADSVLTNVTVNPKPVVGFVLPDICVRDEAVFQNTSTVSSGTLTYKWDFGDGGTSTDQHARHKYTAVGNYNVKLVVTTDQGCRDSLSTVYTVNAATPIPDFTATSLCQKEGVSFTDASRIAFGRVVRWQWTFGDGNTSEEQSPKHTYAAAGTYQVKLKVWSGILCTDSITKAVTILASPTASFTTANVCLGNAATFTNSSTADGSGNLTYQWNFGDTRTSTSPNPTHTYTAPGTYTVTLVARGANGCENTTTRTITVFPTPQADFSPSVGCLANEVMFTDMTSAQGSTITKYEWNFGDGNTSATRSPRYKYSQPGSFTVTFRVTTDKGCTSTATKTVVITPTPVAQAGPDQLLCGKTSTVLAANNTSPAAGAWSVVQGTGGTFSNASDPNATFTGTMGGTYLLRWTASNSPCANVTDDVEIRFRPTPAAEAGEEVTIVQGETITLNGSGEGAFLWSPAESLDDPTSATPAASPTETTKYYLNVTSVDGCPGIDSVVVRVLKKLQIPKAFSPNEDGTHDTWIIEGVEEYPNVRVEIFNRWGELIYTSNGYTTPWDGKRNGKDLPVGAYYYIINPQNGRAKFSGSVTILR